MGKFKSFEDLLAEGAANNDCDKRNHQSSQKRNLSFADLLAGEGLDSDYYDSQYESINFRETEETEMKEDEWAEEDKALADFALAAAIIAMKK